MAEELVVKLATVLNLDELLAFDLLESFFMTNDTTRRTLIYLITIDQNLLNLEQQIRQQGQSILQNPQLASQRLRNMESWKQEFALTVNQVLAESQAVYLQERAALLACVLAVLSHGGEATVKELQPQLMPSLRRNLEALDTFRGFSCSQRDVNASLMREETIILQCMFRLYRKFEVPKPAHILEYLRYQMADTHFKGLRVSRPQAFQSDELLQKLAEKLNALAIQ